VTCDVSGHQCRADFSGEEGALLLVDRADMRALCVVEHWQVYGAGQMVIRELGGRAHVNDAVVAVRGAVGVGDVL
jgi:hypothetical protein